jgi:hypothetical protein
MLNHLLIINTKKQQFVRHALNPDLKSKNVYININKICFFIVFLLSIQHIDFVFHLLYLYSIQIMKKSGINSGFMIVQVAAASIVSENKALCHPASVDTIPTSADKEDHVSMGAWAARKCLMVIANVRRVLAMEMMSATQGIELLRPLKTTKKLEAVLARVRKKVPYFKEDAPFYEAIQEIQRITYEL